MTAPQSRLVVCEVLAIGHASLAVPLLLCNNGEDIEIDDLTFTAVPFDVTLPDDREDGVPTVSITLDNSDQALTPLLRSITGDLSVTVASARAVNLDVSPPTFTIEIVYLPFSLSDCVLTAEAAQLNLSYENGFATEFPADDFTPSDFPGMF